MRVLVFAYACEPDEGSEPGAGWVWARMIARLGDAWVITRRNNRPAIEAALARTPERDRLHFIYLDPPDRLTSWKRGQRGIHAFYLLWLVSALRAARTLNRQQAFDVLWHVTMANVWLGTTAGFVGPPLVFGPVGGALRVPLSAVPTLGVRGAVAEFVRAVIVGAVSRVNPLSRLAVGRATLVLVQNEETRSQLPPAARRRAAVFPNAVMAESVHHALRAGGSNRHEKTALFAGRLLPWKGISLAIRAIVELPGWKLLVCGEGPQLDRSRRLVRSLGVEDRVVFCGAIARADLLSKMRSEADVLLFPSLREEAGWVVAEAVTEGLPVVCVDHGGPPVIAGAAAVRVPVAPGRRLSSRIAAATDRATQISEAAIEQQARALTIDEQASRLRQLLADSGFSVSPAGRVRT